MRRLLVIVRATPQQLNGIFRGDLNINARQMRSCDESIREVSRPFIQTTATSGCTVIPLSIMLASTLLKVALAGSCSLVAADFLNTAWLLNNGEPQGSLQNVSGGQ